MRRAPGHPLAGVTDLVSEARAALFDSIGWGPHPCHWCSTAVDWKVVRKGQSTNGASALVADHVDNDPLNDALENLVPSCQVCNGSRHGRRVQDGERFIVRPNGTRLRAVERTCEHCGTAFLIAPALFRNRPNAGRFCSRSCARRQQHLA